MGNPGGHSKGRLLSKKTSSVAHGAALTALAALYLTAFVLGFAAIARHSIPAAVVSAAVAAAGMALVAFLMIRFAKRIDLEHPEGRDPGLLSVVAAMGGTTVYVLAGAYVSGISTAATIAMVVVPVLLLMTAMAMIPTMIRVEAQARRNAGLAPEAAA